MSEMILGPRLKKERESKGWSLEKVSEELRIPVKFLHGIETDDYNGFPGATYEKAFLKTYAKHVGMNSEDALSLYRELKGVSKPPVVESSAPLKPEDTHLLPKKKQSFVITEEMKYGALIVSVLLLLVSVVFSIRKCSAMAGAGSSAISSEANTNLPKLILTADVTQEVWFVVVPDNQAPNAMLLKPGEKKKWEANNEFMVDIGNYCRGIKLTFDGKPVDLTPYQDKDLTKNIVLKREVNKNGK